MALGVPVGCHGSVILVFPLPGMSKSAKNAKITSQGAQNDFQNCLKGLSKDKSMLTEAEWPCALQIIAQELAHELDSVPKTLPARSSLDRKGEPVQNH